MSNTPNISLPKTWPATVKSAILHVITMAQLAVAYTRSWSANSPNERIRLQARCDQLEDQLAAVTEQLRIIGVRMALVDPYKRPRYPATERMAILQLRAGQGWSLKETAQRFMVARATIASWTRRVDEDGPDARQVLAQSHPRKPRFSSRVAMGPRRERFSQRAPAAQRQKSPRKRPRRPGMVSRDLIWIG